MSSGETSVAFFNIGAWTQVRKQFPVKIMSKNQGQQGIPVQRRLRRHQAVRSEEGRGRQAPREPLRDAGDQRAVQLAAWGKGRPIRSRKRIPEIADVFYTPDELAQYAYIADFEYMASQVDAWAKRWEQEIAPADPPLLSRTTALGSMQKGLSAFHWALLAPGLVLLAGLLAAPMALMAVESFRPFVAGRVGSGAGWTLRNYTELIEPAYAFYFFDTFRVAFIVSAIAVLLGAPIAWLAARTRRRAVRVAIFGLLIGLLFMESGRAALRDPDDMGIDRPARRLRHAHRRAGAQRRIRGHPGFPRAAALRAADGGSDHDRHHSRTSARVSRRPRLRSARRAGALPSRSRSRSPCRGSLRLHDRVRDVHQQFCRAVDPRPRRRAVHRQPHVRFTDVANFPSGAAIGIIMFVLAALVVYAMTLLVRALTPEGTRA